MKKALIGCTAFMLFLAAGVVLAQQATAPAPTPASKAPASAPLAPAAAPAPAVPAAAPAPAAPAAAAPAPAAKAAAAASSLTITRMEISGSIENRQPAGVAASFPASQEKVYCYLEFKDVPRETSITYVFSLGPNVMDKVTQQVKKSWRWRTWASKSLGGMKGDWKVDVMDESGAVLKSATFKVE